MKLHMPGHQWDPKSIKWEPYFFQLSIRLAYRKAGKMGRARLSGCDVPTICLRRGQCTLGWSCSMVSGKCRYAETLPGTRVFERIFFTEFLMRQRQTKSRWYRIRFSFQGEDVSMGIWLSAVGPTLYKVVYTQSHYKQAWLQCDWVVMTSVLVVSQSRCFVLYSREPFRSHGKNRL
jgi:hypothetical protein